MYLNKIWNKINEPNKIEDEEYYEMFNKLRIDLFDWLNDKLSNIDKIVGVISLEHACLIFDDHIEKEKERTFVITATEEVKEDSKKIQESILQELEKISNITVPIFDRENERESGRFRTKKLICDEYYTDISNLFANHWNEQTNTTIKEVISNLRWRWVKFGAKIAIIGGVTVVTAGVGTDLAGGVVAAETAITAVTVARAWIAAGSIIPTVVGAIDIIIMKVSKGDGVKFESGEIETISCLRIPEFDVN